MEVVVDAWERPRPSSWDGKQDLVFQLTYTDGFVHRAAKGYDREQRLRLHGCTREGYAVMVQVLEFKPYFFCEAPQVLGPGACRIMRSLLDRAAKDLVERRGRKRPWYDLVHRVTIVRGRSVMGYRNKDSYFFRIEANFTYDIVKLRETIEGYVDDDTPRLPPLEHRDLGVIRQQTYESNVLYELRFLIDKGISGASWVRIPGGKYASKLGDDCVGLLATCYHCDVGPQGSVRDMQPIAPLRIISYDIETLTLDPESPEALVIQIAAALYEFGNPEPVHRVLFSLGSCDGLKEADDVFCFGPEDECLASADRGELHMGEEDLLLAWRDYLKGAVPDVLTVISSKSSQFSLERGQRRGALSCSCKQHSTARRCQAHSNR